MAISILTNTTSLSAQRGLSNTQYALNGNVQKLSSGQRINKAADDSAALGISEKLKADIRSTAQASRNANDGISMTQIAEGALNEVADIMTRMRELAVQSSNGTLGDTERGFIDQEFGALRSEINRISEVTEFNGIKLLNGSAAGTGIALQIGVRNSNSDKLTILIATINAQTLSLSGTTSLSTQLNAQAALSTIDTAISTISSRRASLGAIQNRLQSTISNLSSSIENLSAANSRIRDVDVAEETSSLTRNQILSQSGAAMLSQANQLPQVALSLLR